MSFSLSSTSISSLRSSFGSQELKFINELREVSYSTGSYITPSISLFYPLFTEYIKSFNFQEDYFTFVTDYSSLSSYINTFKNYGGSYFGSNMCEYDLIYDDIKNDFSAISAFPDTSQYLGIVDKNFNFNILPLKTKTSLNDSCYSITDNYKNYQKTYELDNVVYSQFTVDKIPVTINPDEYTLLFNSYGVLSSYIKDYKFIENGAIGGNCPLNSDVILFDQSEYSRYNNSGTQNVNAPNNGSMLCLWLSSETPDSRSNKIWMERWYDPNTTTQKDVFITQKNTLSSFFSYIRDIPSLKIFSEKEKLTYLRYGPARNETFVNNISSNLVINFNQWGENFESTVNGISGFVIGNYPKSSDTLILDGTVHAHIPPDDIISISNNITVSLWANSSDWSSSNDTQLFGNYYNETGYGIAFNNGTSNHLISIPTISENLFAINDRGFKVFEKDLKDDIGLSDIRIEYIKTDFFGNRWLYDDFNKNLYKIENDDLVIHTVALPVNSKITKMECDSNNNIFVLDTYSHQISSFNSAGSYLSTINLNSYPNNFDILSDNTVVYDNAEFLIGNGQDKIVKMYGPTLIIDGKKVLYLTDRPHTVRLDLDDNIWILFENRIIKTDPTGKMIFDKILEIPFTVKTAEMCFVKTNKNNLDEVNLWIIYNEQKYAAVLNLDGKIVKRIDISRLFVGNQCKDFQLNIKGDFTGFDNKRKFERFDGKTISPTNPTLTLRIGLKCGDNKKIVSLHTSPKYLRTWTHLAFSIQAKKDYTIVDFYVNGKLEKTESFSGNYRIDYGYNSSPFIIGGHSGKLGAKNLEKSITNKGFFRGEISDIRLYNKVLNDFEVLNLALNKHYDKWSPITMHIKSPKITMLEEIDTFHINRYKGFKSNYFNVVIKNFTDNEDLKTLVSDYIKANISQYIPANTMLNEIKFE